MVWKKGINKLQYNLNIRFSISNTNIYIGIYWKYKLGQIYTDDIALHSKKGENINTDMIKYR